LVFKYYLNTQEGGSIWKVYKYLLISICCNNEHTTMGITFPKYNLLSRPNIE